VSGRSGFSSEQLPPGTRDLEPPLDAIDGAARILDPIFTGINTVSQPASRVLLRLSGRLPGDGVTAGKLRG
jgi:hypothetical protein